METLYVVKRDGTEANVRFDSITDRNETLCSSAYGHALKYVQRRLPAITQEVTRRFKNGMTTHELDMLTATICAEMSSYHQDFNDLAARIIVSDLQKSTPASILAVVKKLRDEGGRVFDEYEAIVKRAATEIDRRIVHARDFVFGCFGIQTMIRSYLWHSRNKSGPIVERPQHTYMRIALIIALGRPDRGGGSLPEDEFRAGLEYAFQVYDLLSTHRLTHASPTMFNAGAKMQQMASCFLLSVSDNLTTLFDVVKDSALLSKGAGGIGTSITPMRAKGSLIRSTGGTSSGIRQYVQVLQSRNKYINQGDRRPGADAIYIEPWHEDIFTFLEMGRVKGVKENAPRLKYALWVPDMFMEALTAELAESETGKSGTGKSETGKSEETGGSKKNGGSKDTGGSSDWYLFSPDTAPGLHLAHGEEFRALYAKYVKEKRYTRVVKPSAIMREWFVTVAQAGNPYVLFKDHVNRKSNLSHVRTIACSNLCAEITIPSWHDEGETDKAEYGVCFLAAVPLASYVVYDARAKNPGRVRVDWEALVKTAGVAARNLDRLVDINFTPVEACQRSSRRHRPVAVGVMGLADVLAMFRYAYGSPEARALDRALHAAIYYGAMSESSRLGERLGNFASFEGSASQRGLLQPDLWVACGHLEEDWAAGVAASTSGFLTPAKWDALRKRCSKFLRNSYVTADMPTATSSQVTGQNECFEPYTSNLYTRRTLAGEFVVLNRYLVAELEELKLWDDEMRTALLSSDGSVQGVGRVPADVRRRYRTARELDQRLLTLHAKARNPFLSQTQSLNYYFGEPRLSEMLTVLVLGWKEGLTTGSYYMYTQPARGSQKTMVTSSSKSSSSGEPLLLSNQAPVCLNKEDCTSCSV